MSFEIRSVKLQPWRLLGASAGMLAAPTLCYIGFGLSVQGDAFGPGLGFWPALVGAAALGALLGWKARGPVARLLLIAAMFAAAAFWLLVPDGWWALGPPHMDRYSS